MTRVHDLKSQADSIAQPKFVVKYSLATPAKEEKLGCKWKMPAGSDKDHTKQDHLGGSFLDTCSRLR